MKKEIKVYSGIGKLPTGSASNAIEEGCLVIEGGAFRGLYNQGALDAMMLNDINIRTVIGVSAGALAGMNYVSGQIGRSGRANLTYRHDTRYIGRKAFQKSGSILNVDFLLKDFEEIDPLNKARLDSQDRHFIAVATNCLNGQTEYYDKDNCSDVRTAVRASASMPYMTPMVYVDGTPCLDGGCSCKIPYQWALDQGFEKIVIIRTRDRNFRKKVKDSKLAGEFYREYPEFAEVLARSSRDYNHQCDEINELEQQGRAYVIAPEVPVHVGRIESDMEKLGELYWQGYNETMSQMQKLKEYLGVSQKEA